MSGASQDSGASGGQVALNQPGVVLASCVQRRNVEAVKKVDEESQKKMGGMLGGLGLPPGLF